LILNNVNILYFYILFVEIFKYNILYDTIVFLNVRTTSPRRHIKSLVGRR